MWGVSNWWRQRTVEGGTVVFHAESWLGGQHLADLPVVEGSWRIENDSQQKTPGAVSFEVPNTSEWRPTSPDHPLADYGQHVRVSAGYKRSNETSELIPLGHYRLERSIASGSTITVKGAGLLADVEKARLLYPFQAAGMTRYDVVVQMLQGVVPLSVHIVNERCPDFTCEEDRLQGVLDVVDGWGGRLWVDNTGIARISPKWDDDNPGDPVADLTSGPDGTVTTGGVTLDPDTTGGYNAYKVSTVPAGDEAAVFEIATIGSGPMRWGGPYGYRPAFYSSNLLTGDRERLRQVAQQMVQRSIRRVDAYKVESSPRYELGIGDVVHLASPAVGVDCKARIVSWTHTRTSSSFKCSYLSGKRGSA